MHQIASQSTSIFKIPGGGGGMPPDPPLVARALGAHLARYAPKLSPPASLSSTSTFFEKENPAQCEAEQGNNWFLVCFIGQEFNAFFFNKTVYRVLSISARDKKWNISESSSNRMNNHWLKVAEHSFRARFR